MANLPVKVYKLGFCKAAVFQSDYQGKPSYSIKIQKSYFDKKEGAMKNTDYFSLTDIRDLYGLIGAMLHNQVKTETPQQRQPSQQPAPATSQQPATIEFEDVGGDVPY